MTMDNLERFPGVGGSGDITAHPTYNPDQEVGSYSDFARDFLEAGGGSAVPAEPFQGSASDLSDFADDPKSADIWSVGGTSAQVVVDVGSSGFNVGQFGIPTNAVQILLQNSQRTAVTILNTDANNTCYIGPNSSLNVDSGFPIGPGNSFTASLSAGVWAVADANLKVAVFEFLAS